MAERYFLYPTADLKSLVVWDMERQQPLGQLEGHDDVIRVVAARGSLAVSCQHSGPVRARVWNLETMQCTASLPRVPNNVEILLSACCTESKILLGQNDGLIKLWDVAASTPVPLADLEGHTSGVCEVKAAAAGSMVLSGSEDTTVRLWDLRASHRCVRTMEGHSLSACTVDMDGHGRTAVSGSWDSTVKLWDLGSGRCMETYEGQDNDEVIDVVMHESGSSFLSYDTNGIVSAWAVGGAKRALMRANMASSCLPETAVTRLFACGDLSEVAFCSISPSQLWFSCWR